MNWCGLTAHLMMYDNFACLLHLFFAIEHKHKCVLNSNVAEGIEAEHENMMLHDCLQQLLQSYNMIHEQDHKIRQHQNRPHD